MNNNKEEKKEISVKYEIDGNEIILTPSIVQKYIVGSNAKLTPTEYKFFTELCKVRKLNPFLSEAYLIKYSDKSPAQLVVGKDAILKRAVKNTKYNGMEHGIIVLNENNEVIERAGTFKLESEKLVGGWARVYIKNREYPSYESVSFDEVAQRKSNGELNSNWATKGATMVAKVAKVRALREAFVEDLEGMYEEEEMKHEFIEPQKHGSDKTIIEQNEEEIKEAVIFDEETGEIDMNEL